MFRDTVSMESAAVAATAAATRSRVNFATAWIASTTSAASGRYMRFSATGCSATGTIVEVGASKTKKADARNPVVERRTNATTAIPTSERRPSTAGRLDE